MNPMILRRAAASVCWLALAAASRADSPEIYKDASLPLETRVDDLLPRLTQEEKLLILGGDREFYIRPIPRLGLPEVKMADGPLGVRNYGPSTAYPATIGLAATWDRTLAEDYGASVARDARARGVSIMLGPAVNINRVPQNGRNFEYLSEDPFLAGQIAARIVVGMQGGGVVATVKHYAANNQETLRDRIDETISERALREIYLPAFQAAVQEGHAWAAMSAYNKVNGTYCSANDWLNNTVLKGEWGFKGVLMSDWGAAHDTLGVTNGGLDLEMPSGRYMNPATLAPLIESGKVSQATIDDKVRRILRLEIANGFLDRPQQLDTPKDDPKSAAIALKIAHESIVLLKNERNALPLAAKRLKRVVVLGPNALTLPSGGGSAHVEAFHYVSVVDGLRKTLGSKKKVEVIEAPGAALLDRLAPASGFEGPLKLEFLAGDWRHRKTLATVQDSKIDRDWKADPPPAGIDLVKTTARWTGTIRPSASGKYIFLVRNHGNTQMRLDGKQLIGSWFNPNDTLFAVETLEAGRSYSVEVAAVYDGVGTPDVHFGWGIAPPLLTPQDEEKIRDADAAVVCVGYNIMLEGEGADRSYSLPDGQAELIRRTADLNPRTIVVVNSGGVVETADWVASAAALLQAWYPGQEGGQAVADVILGQVNPSGRLPISYEKRREDSPSYGNYPGNGEKVTYAEGIFVGYRWFDAKGIAPLFPFGFGLSYTSFHYANLTVDPTAQGTWKVSFDVTNNGLRAGDEISEVYVSPPVNSRVPRAVRELKGFARLRLATDEKRTGTVLLDRSSFAYYDEGKKAWVVEPGTYTVAVGSSSRDLQLTTAVEIR